MMLVYKFGQPLAIQLKRFKDRELPHYVTHSLSHSLILLAFLSVFLFFYFYFHDKRHICIASMGGCSLFMRNY
jgi:hypothetical protein